ncbi:CHRD domain-containing protein [Spongiactinospora sp. TRM90649]|uniref:CHRD domain-containing protein n=1 Tax=Spongiactinospora sp. TRM90649 TaxID=3031114 RepID=UPI0023F77908|nr:CHRD domain-containing protein [Spongiactinospora sp. TRM90649]MDF5752091.1 CHRD domain-containing protein [Spongiactinospora sp. TRM90649]
MFTRTIAASALATAALTTSLAAVPAQAAASADAYFAATLSGRNEVPVKGGPAVGDRDGRAVALFRLHGNKVSYAIRWRNVAAPTAFHIHRGKAGSNGDVKLGFFGEALPGSARAVTGTVSADPALLARIRQNPANWYANLHTGEFPGGAVRAQLHRIRPTGLTALLGTGSKTSFAADATGAQEVPAPGQKVGDRDGRARWLLWINGGRANYATVWNRIGAPTNAHVHRGKAGVNGPVVLDFFAAAKGLPASITGIAGTVPIKADIAAGIRRAPKNWYTNLHTGEFPGGAVRGALHRVSGGW